MIFWENKGKFVRENKKKLEKNRFFDFYIQKLYTKTQCAVGKSMFSSPKFDELYEKMGFACVSEVRTLNFNEKPLKTPIFTLFF